ncbi:MAG: hypothetical protein RIR12_219 [Bacteroidota bacterium]|jgi:predicted nucleic acid-binding protein
MEVRKAAIDYLTVVPFTQKIKETTIALKQKHKAKLPDPIIAASAIVEGLALVTADKAFKRFDDLSLILITP